MTDKAELSSTERQLRDALARLVHQKPINRELKQKLKANKLKIVVSNVEKEAGLSNGSARRYPETKALIESAEANRVHGVSNVSDTVVRGHPLHIKAKEDLDKAKKEIKKLMHVPAHSDHPFRFNPITDFGLIRSLISVLSGQK
ncbi:hypothetical protein ALT1545_40012 [Alteromonas macleodii]